MLRNYFAGFESAAVQYDIDLRLLDVLPYRLLAYNAMADGKLDDFYFKSHWDRFEEIILDSGAYWAWRNHGEINRQNYLDYCIRHKDRIHNFVVLDRIPGRYAPKGQRVQIPESAYVASAEVTYENYRHMVKRMGEAGVSPDRIIHVFHMREPFSFLREMVDIDKVPYIGLSVSNARGVKKSERHQWLNDCMEVLRNEDGTLKYGVKLHAFGISSFKWLSEFPWHSADASSWGIEARNSCVFMPSLRKHGRRSYNGVPFELKWNFSKITGVDFGNIAEGDGFWLNKKFGGNRQTCLSYRMTAIHYVTDLGLNVGHSIFRRRDSGVYRSDLVPGEQFIGKDLSDTREENKFGRADPNIQWTVQKISEGLQDSIVFRMWINALTTNHFTAQRNEQQEGKKIFYPGTLNSILEKKGNGNDK